MTQRRSDSVLSQAQKYWLANRARYMNMGDQCSDHSEHCTEAIVCALTFDPSQGPLIPMVVQAADGKLIPQLTVHSLVDIPRGKGDICYFSKDQSVLLARQHHLCLLAGITQLRPILRPDVNGQNTNEEVFWDLERMPKTGIRAQDVFRDERAVAIKAPFSGTFTLAEGPDASVLVLVNSWVVAVISDAATAISKFSVEENTYMEMGQELLHFPDPAKPEAALGIRPPASDLVMTAHKVLVDPSWCINAYDYRTNRVLRHSAVLDPDDYKKEFDLFNALFDELNRMGVHRFDKFASGNHNPRIMDSARINLREIMDEPLADCPSSWLPKPVAFYPFVSPSGQPVSEDVFFEMMLLGEKYVLGQSEEQDGRTNINFARDVRTRLRDGYCLVLENAVTVESIRRVPAADDVPTERQRIEIITKSVDGIESRHVLPCTAIVYVKEGLQAKPGDVLARACNPLQHVSADVLLDLTKLLGDSDLADDVLADTQELYLRSVCKPTNDVNISNGRPGVLVPLHYLAKTPPVEKCLWDVTPAMPYWCSMLGAAMVPVILRQGHQNFVHRTEGSHSLNFTPQSKRYCPQGAKYRGRKYNPPAGKPASGRQESIPA